MAPPRARAGFTLIEMIVVIVILGLVASLVMVSHPWRSTTLNTDATLKALDGALRVARSRAIAQDRDVGVVFTTQGFSMDGAAEWRLPRGEELSPARLIFLPDGGSSGGTIALAAGSRRIAITVDWLTGRARSTELNAK